MRWFNENGDEDSLSEYYEQKEKRLVKKAETQKTHKTGIIKTNGCWCEIDELNDVALKGGEVIDVEWPSKKWERIKVILEVRSYPTNDMWNIVTIPVSLAYVNRSINGVQVKVYLAGLRAHRV